MLLVTSQILTFSKEFSETLEKEEFEQAKKIARKISPFRLSHILIEFPQETVLKFFEHLKNEEVALISSNFPPDFNLTLFRLLSEDRSIAIINEMPPDSVAEFIEELPGELTSKIERDLLVQVESLTNFPKGSAGSIMSPYFLAVESSALVGEVIEVVRSAPTEVGRTSYVFIVESNSLIQSGRLVGVVSIRELLLSSLKTPVTQVMNSSVMAVRTEDDALEAAKRIKSRNLKMLPVVDQNDVLVGIIHITKAIDLLTHELADEFVSINAASPDESFFTHPQESIQKRLPWMGANIFLNLGAVAVISSFEDTLVQVAILAAFLPMITDMGGNVGIQALSVSIRSMALGEAQLRDFWKAVRKEVFIGLFNGLALGVLFAGLAYLLQGNFVLGIVAGVALGVNVLVAGVVGGTMPFLIKRIGKDPAMMTGPVLTTITDITGVSIYLGLSTLFLSSLMSS